LPGSERKKEISMSIVLPPLTTEAGVMARLLVNESMVPGLPHNPHYSEEQSLRGMRLMKVVIDNRLNHRPPASAGYLANLFNAPQASNYIDIIVSGQFAGFSRSGGTVQTSAGVTANIDAIVQEANQGKPGFYFRFVQNAITVANAPVVADEFAVLSPVGSIAILGRTYGWRTSGHGAPGPNFIAIPNGAIGGNQFFTLRSHAV
jgi:hypothetical protein